MRSTVANAVLLLLLATLPTPIALAEDGAEAFAARRDGNWHAWRGLRADGVAPAGDPPLRWGEGVNIQWKVAIPGEGSATPIVWEDRLFVVSAVETDRKSDNPPAADERAKTNPPEHIYQFVVWCLDRATGRVRWRHVACEEVPHEGRHSTNTYASASPTTDGRRLYVSFGSRGIYCYDLEGKPLWKRDLGDMRTRYGWGEATSPVVHGGRVIVNWDHEDQSFIEVLDAATGKTAWKADRDEPTSWATPLVVDQGGRTQVIVNGTNRVRSYRLADGEIVWQCGGQTVNAIPSPVLADGLVYCMSGYRGSLAVAIPLDAQGDLTGTDKITWRHDTGTPYVPSPIVVGGQVYFTRSNTAVLSCLDAKTGAAIFKTQRLPGLGSVYASPVAAGERIYFTDRDGVTVVIRHGKKLDVLATNRLDEPTDASPAIAGRQMFLRTARHVYCIEETRTGTEE